MSKHIRKAKKKLKQQKIIRKADVVMVFVILILLILSLLSETAAGIL